MNEPKCPACGHTVPIVHSYQDPRQRWARHTQTGNLTSGDSPECPNGGQPWAVSEAVARAIFDANPYQTWRWDELPAAALIAYHEMTLAAISTFNRLT